MHFASRRDANDAVAVGEAAVKAAIEGMSGFMVTLLAKEATTGLTELEKVANVERKVPVDWINREGNFATAEFLDYARPLLQGEIKTEIEDGLPVYVQLEKSFIQL